MPKLTNSSTDYPTINETARRTGIGSKRIRRAVKSGELVLHRLAGVWPRLFWPEVQRWIAASRTPVSDHAEARVREILEREERNANP